MLLYGIPNTPKCEKRETAARETMGRSIAAMHVFSKGPSHSCWQIVVGGGWGLGGGPCLVTSSPNIDYGDGILKTFRAGLLRRADKDENNSANPQEHWAGLSSRVSLQDWFHRKHNRDRPGHNSSPGRSNWLRNWNYRLADLTLVDGWFNPAIVCPLPWGFVWGLGFNLRLNWGDDILEYFCVASHQDSCARSRFVDFNGQLH